MASAAEFPAPGAELSSRAGTTDLWAIARLAPGGGPGTWTIATFLPIAEYPHRDRVTPSAQGIDLAELTVLGGVPDIADHVIENAVMAFEAERIASKRGKKKMTNAQKVKAKVASIKSRMSRSSAKAKAPKRR